MAVSIETLLVSEEVSATTDVVDTYTPPSGAEVWLKHFEGNGAFSANSVVCVLWDYGEAGEEIVWSKKGNDKMSDQTQLQITASADGSKKVAVCCSNGENGAVIMSGIAVLKVIT